MKFRCKESFSSEILLEPAISIKIEPDSRLRSLNVTSSRPISLQPQPARQKNPIVRGKLYRLEWNASSLIFDAKTRSALH